MSHSAKNPRFRGVFPVVPTIFNEAGELDLEGQKRCLDFMIDAGSNGLVHPGQLLRAVRPVRRRARGADPHDPRPCGRPRAGDRHDDAFQHRGSAPSAAGGRRRPGASMVMVMPPYHGATFRVPEVGDLRLLPHGVGRDRHPDHDPGRAGGRHAAVGGLPGPHGAGDRARRATSRSRSPGAASKLRELIQLGGDAIEGPWDGEEAITLLADLDAGATGTMTGGGYPDGIRPIVDASCAGRREEAVAGYARWLPLINYENRQCGLLAAKALMKEGGVIACDAPRHPIAADAPGDAGGADGHGEAA